MKQTLLISMLLLFCAIGVSAQGPGPVSQDARRIISGTSVPNATCSPGPSWRSIYIRTTDGSIYECTAAPNTWTKVVGGGTPGNVVGPASATDNHLAVFDGITGKLIKDGGAIPSATPAGSDTQVQFNDGGSAFGGDAGLTYNKTTDALTINGALQMSGVDGAGYVQLRQQSASNPSASIIGPRLFANSTYLFGWKNSSNSSGKAVTFDDSGLSADRSYTLFDASGVLTGSAAALTSGRVPFATTGGLLTDSANLTWTSPTLMLAGASLSGPDVEVKITGDTFSRVAMGINIADVARIGFGPGSSARDAFIEYGGAGKIKFGGTDTDLSTNVVPQVARVQDVLTGGTADQAGKIWTFVDSGGKGTGVSGGYAWQVHPAGSTGTSLNAASSIMTLNPVTTGNGLAIASSAVTSGNLVSITASGTVAASSTKTALNVATSGANAASAQTTYGAQIANTSTGTTSVNVGLAVAASGGATNTALRVDGLTTMSVGQTTSALTDLLINPTTKASGNLIDLQVNGASQFSVSSAGNVVNAGTYIAPAAQFFRWSASTTLSAPTNGNLILFDSGRNTFNALQFGGANNSHPAIISDAVNGFTLQSAAGTATWNDASTAGSGTVANRYLFGIAAPTLTGTNSSVVYTVASSFFIGGAPANGTNVTVTTPYALNVAAGNVIFGSLAGTGSRAVLADANGVLSAPVSDSRLKTNVQTLDGDILGKLAQLRGVYFDFIPTDGVSLTNDKRRQLGMIADEVEKIIPEAVGFNTPINGTAYRYLNYEVLIPFLVEALKAQQREIVTLQSQMRRAGQ